MSRPTRAIGEAVRVLRNVRNDGTYPGAALGALLVRRGETGTVVDVGYFLGEQVIYTVHFLDCDRKVGCREEELAAADAPWVPSRFESRERVAAARVLAVGDAVRIEAGSAGEVLRVLRDESSVLYHVHFDDLPGRTLAVPETALRALDG